MRMKNKWQVTGSCSYHRFNGNVVKMVNMSLLSLSFLLASMPFLPPSMTSLKLSQNRFTNVPEAILNLPQ